MQQKDLLLHMLHKFEQRIADVRCFVADDFDDFTVGLKV